MMRIRMQFWLLQTWLLFSPLVQAAAARAPELDLTWQAPSDCPDQASMHARVEGLLAQRAAPWTDLQATARVEKRGHHFWLTMDLLVQGHWARRELSAESCAGLSEVAAWLLVVAVDPHLSVPRAEAAAPADPAPTEPKYAEPASDTERPPRESPVTRLSTPKSRYRLGLFTGVLAVGLAGPTASLGGRAGIGFGRVVLELFAMQHMQRATAVDAMGGSGRFASQELGLAGCVVWGEQLRAGPCLALSGLRTEATTVGDLPDRDTTTWAIGTLSLTIDYRVFDSFQLRLDGGLLTSLTTRPSFEVDGIMVGEAARRGAMIRFGLEALL
jgi:hypothetical protein